MTIAWTVLAFLVSAFAAIGFCIWWYGFDQLEGILKALQSSDNAAYDGLLLSQIYVSSAIVQIGVVFIAILARHCSITDYLALDLPRGQTIIKALAVLFVVIVCLDGITSLLGQNPASKFQVTSYTTARDSRALALYFLTVVIVAPITEEIIFRGFLYRGFTHIAGSEPYVVAIISFAFAAAHYSQYNLGELSIVFVVGLLLGLARWLSGSTTLTILMHMFGNFIATIETVIYVEWIAK